MRLPRADRQGRGRERVGVILDVFGNAASVRLEMSGWIDYMHVAKFGDERNVNVLWELKPRQ